MFNLRIDNYTAYNIPIIYIDESGFAHDSPRLRGYSIKGKRCYGVQDWQAKGRTNVIGGLLGKELLRTCCIKGNINADVFYAWVTQELIKHAPKNAVIVMDNATFHKRKDIIEAIEKAGLTLDFLPPYSPDLNPIEKTWAKPKALRRKMRCSIEELFQMQKFESM